MWNTAAHAPIFCKITKKKLPDGQTKDAFRTARLIGSHAYKIAASGAAMHASQVLAGDCNRLRMSAYRESSRAPWLPTLSAGARMVLEQFLSALAQEAAYKGHAVREGCGYSKRLSKKHILAGWNATYDSVFGSSTLLPRSMVTLPVVKKSKKGSSSKSSGKRAAVADDEEYQPPEEGEGDASGDVNAVTGGE